MATDKSLNIRTTKAAEQTAAAMSAINQKLDALKAQLDRIEAALQPRIPTSGGATVIRQPKRGE